MSGRATDHHPATILSGYCQSGYYLLMSGRAVVRQATVWEALKSSQPATEKANFNSCATKLQKNQR